MNIDTEELDDLYIIPFSVFLIKDCVLPQYNNHVAISCYGGLKCLIIDKAEHIQDSTTLTVLRNKFFSHYEYLFTASFDVLMSRYFHEILKKR